MTNWQCELCPFVINVASGGGRGVVLEETAFCERSLLRRIRMQRRFFGEINLQPADFVRA